MVFDEMRPKIRHVYLTFAVQFGKFSEETQQENETHARAQLRLNRQTPLLPEQYLCRNFIFQLAIVTCSSANNRHIISFLQLQDSKLSDHASDVWQRLERRGARHRSRWQHVVELRKAGVSFLLVLLKGPMGGEGRAGKSAGWGTSGIVTAAAGLEFPCRFSHMAGYLKSPAPPPPPHQFHPPHPGLTGPFGLPHGLDPVHPAVGFPQAQLVEQLAADWKVRGSIPGGDRTAPRSGGRGREGPKRRDAVAPWPTPAQRVVCDCCGADESQQLFERSNSGLTCCENPQLKDLLRSVTLTSFPSVTIEY
ncbi:hypothetical protein ANN_18934 [Periplaneta americana]|uniref:Uncharacterized protein n=1 Tax=Periplaneta americana TaxID=6978 RepID=A0ABQ8SQ35_PERAM|nr:hypothetical protein ANN_18934 [Periplaneta americana]